VYLRQSSDKQVRQNKESQLLQYAVAERVRALGWAQVEIINSDLGSSAGIASAQREVCAQPGASTDVPCSVILRA
jgi:DNA invertase Pin-like site-specific DNA recombinase